MEKLSCKWKEKIVKKLLPLKPEKIILFGSYAYGTPNKDSDIDLCIIEKKYNSKMEEKKKVRQLLGNIDYAVDILIPTLEEYNFYKNEFGSVYKEIECKGEVLWKNF